MFLIWIFFVLRLGSRPDQSKTGGKKGLKVIRDPRYRRYGNKVDMDSALETFTPVRSDSKHFTTGSYFSDYFPLPSISQFYCLTVSEAQRPVCCVAPVQLVQVFSLCCLLIWQPE